MLRNRFVLLNVTLALVLIQVMVWVLLLKHNQLPKLVPLFYLQAWGEKQLATSRELWWLPGLSILFLAVNLTLAYYFYRRQRLLAQLLILTTVLLSLLAFLALRLILWRIGIL